MAGGAATATSGEEEEEAAALAAMMKRLEEEGYSACDVSDALLKLGVAGAGFLPDLVCYSGGRGGEPPVPSSASATTTQLALPASTTAASPPGAPPSAGRGRVTVAVASTVLFARKGEDTTSSSSLPEPNMPKGSNWADLTVPNTVVVVQQPQGQANAVCGGIMALRMGVRGVRGVVVLGRARDRDELVESGLAVSKLDFLWGGRGLLALLSFYSPLALVMSVSAWFGQHWSRPLLRDRRLGLSPR